MPAPTLVVSLVLHPRERRNGEDLTTLVIRELRNLSSLSDKQIERMIEHIFDEQDAKEMDKIKAAILSMEHKKAQPKHPWEK